MPKKVWILNVFLFHYFLIKSQLSDYINFTFMHMEDTFIQSDVQPQIRKSWDSMENANKTRK